MSDEVKLAPVDAADGRKYGGEVWVRGRLDFATSGALIVVFAETAFGPIQVSVHPDEVYAAVEAQEPAR